MNNLILNFTLIYEYISDPPIFVDIGSIFFLVHDLNLYIDVSPVLSDENQLNIEFNTFNMSMSSLEFEMDGISDMS